MNGAPQSCPLCRSDRSALIGGELYRCRTCGAAFNRGHHALQYDDDYFIKEYRNQYGRTYEEDYPHIYALAQRRLDDIFSLMKTGASPGSLSLIDIGSALGFFLKAGRDRGVGNVAGIEISEYASSWCRDKLGIPVLGRSFDSVAELPPSDIITAWFFIEHCPDPRAVLQRIYDALKPGGVLAFSAPALSGPLYRFHREEWIRTHPADHRVDFTPASARRLLKNMGFRKVMVKPCGIHPERVVRESSPLYRPFSALYGLYSRLTAWSDTIEVYALK